MPKLFIGPAGLLLVGGFLVAIGVFWSALQQMKTEQDLRKKSDEIARLSLDAVRSITGGDSYCFILLIPIGEGRFGVGVFHKGKHPLYDVHVRMVNLDRLDEKRSLLSIESLAYTDTNLDIGTLIPEHVTTRGNVDLAALPKRGFNIFFSARNGDFTQLLRFAIVGDNLTQATRVLRDGEIIHEEINPGFPRSESGQVEWE